MNKHLTLLAAGTMLVLAACNTGTDHGAGTMTQAQIDSAVNARTAEQEARIQRNNDSLINAMAQMKADSMMNASKNGGMQKQGTVVAKTGTRIIKSGASTTTTTSTTKDGRLNTDKNTSKNNDGRLNTDKNTDSKDKKKGNDGRLKTD